MALLLLLHSHIVIVITYCLAQGGVRGPHQDHLVIVIITIVIVTIYCLVQGGAGGPNQDGLVASSHCLCSAQCKDSNHGGQSNIKYNDDDDDSMNDDT